jgi:hypothetical protein
MTIKRFFLKSFLSNVRITSDIAEVKKAAAFFMNSPG